MAVAIHATCVLDAASLLIDQSHIHVVPVFDVPAKISLSSNAEYTDSSLAVFRGHFVIMKRSCGISFKGSQMLSGIVTTNNCRLQFVNCVRAAALQWSTGGVRARSGLSSVEHGLLASTAPRTGAEFNICNTDTPIHYVDSLVYASDVLLIIYYSTL